jgi:hypothetical protein
VKLKGKLLFQGMSQPIQFALIFFDLFIDFPEKSKYGISRDFVKAFDIEFINQPTLKYRLSLSKALFSCHPSKRPIRTSRIQPVRQSRLFDNHSHYSVKVTFEQTM